MMPRDAQIKKRLKDKYPDLYEELNEGRPSAEEFAFRLLLNEEEIYKKIVEELGGFVD